jgi:AcrR family transcriptional regulator
MNDRSTAGDADNPGVDALLDAIERICATRSPSALSMRGIADEANCSLGLAYNHFESKEQLVTAALDRMAERLTASTAVARNPGESLLTLLEAMQDNPAFPRLLTWLILEGHNVSEAMSGHPLMREVAADARELGATDPATTAMTMGVLAIGTCTYGSMLNRAVGRDSDDMRLTATVAEIYDSFFPGPLEANDTPSR